METSDKLRNAAVYLKKKAAAEHRIKCAQVVEALAALALLQHRLKT